MATKKAKPTRNTTAQYTAKENMIRYIYDAGDNRFGLARQPKMIADELIRTAITLEEDGDYLTITLKNGTSYKYFLSELDKADDGDEQ